MADQQIMDPREAFKLVDAAVSNLNLTRQGHVQLQAALVSLSVCVEKAMETIAEESSETENQPEAEVATT
jgi:hypothetical protein